MSDITPPKAENERVKILDDSLDAFKEEYRELSETWRHIETKAQGTVSIAGIFIAAAFAFVHYLSETAPSCERLLLGLALALLGLCVLLSIAALAVREVKAAPIGETLYGMVTELVDAGEARDAESIDNFVRDQIGLWNEVNEEVRAVNHSKARYLLCAQVALVAALVTVATLAMIRIFG